jgi:phosphate:Na+ symporter
VSQPPELQIFPLLTGLFGGLALFLYGMDQLADSLKTVAGGRMKTLLSRLTTNRFMGAVSGALVTAVIQSSSVTTVLVVGFISAGLMTMVQSVGVIMGANIGTTITAQIVAFNVTEYALVLVAVGFAVRFLSKRERIMQYGMILMGLGLIFFGMGIMGDAMDPLREAPFFLDWMRGMETPALGILVGALFTALVQSSSATTGVVIVLASQGFITLPAGIALAFGANVGTCVTALLAAIGKPREAVRAAGIHVLFNVLGVLIWLGFIDGLSDLVVAISPATEGLMGMERLAADTPRQIANAHTLFNVVNTALFLPLAGVFAKLVVWIFPEKPLPDHILVKPRYLDQELIRAPVLAVDRVRMEVLHMGDRVRQMMVRILPQMFEGERDDLLETRVLDEGVDFLHGHIITYLGRLSQENLTEEVSSELMGLMEAANDLEAVGDIIETNLVGQGLERVEEGVSVSVPTRKLLMEFHAVILRGFDLALQAVSQESRDAAQAVVEMKDEVNEMAARLSKHQARRLVADEPRRLETYALEVDVIKNLKRVYYFSKRMARSILYIGEARL